jgi:hypothetical protein
VRWWLFKCLQSVCLHKETCDVDCPSSVILLAAPAVGGDLQALTQLTSLSLEGNRITSLPQGPYLSGQSIRPATATAAARLLVMSPPCLQHLHMICRWPALTAASLQGTHMRRHRPAAAAG